MAATLADPSLPHARLPRIAFCTDTFDEANGVARISREFAAYAQRNRLELLIVRPGPTRRCYSEGSVSFVDIPKSPLCLPLDMGLRFDLLVSRHYRWLRDQLALFAPEIVHITGPGDIGMICARLSKVIRTPDVPLVAGWHTNVHQYARMRAEPWIRWLPASAARALGGKIETTSLWAVSRFYRTARFILAPNAEALNYLTTLTAKPGALMPHGVSTDLFAPVDRASREHVTLGYVGRLTAEKNVRFIAEIEERLPADVRRQVRFLMVGDGHERGWLESRLKNARFSGVLRDQALARAFAEMDVFLFPSRSDTLGLVVLEAMAAGLPVVAFKLAGPRSSVHDGETGYTANNGPEFIDRVVNLVRDRELRGRMGRAARHAAGEFCWDAVFASFYDAYRRLAPAGDAPGIKAGITSPVESCGGS